MDDRGFLLLAFALLIVLGLVVTHLMDRRDRKRGMKLKSQDDNIIRKNVEKPCSGCGTPVVTDTFTSNPLCPSCQEARK